MKLIVFCFQKWKSNFELPTYLCFFADLLTSRIDDRSHIVLMKYKLNCFVLAFIRFKFDFVMFFYYRHRVLAVYKVCCLIFINVLSGSPIINNFHRLSNVALWYFIDCLVNAV